MGGVNPYHDTVEVRLPPRPYTITFQPMGVAVEVDPTCIPYTRDGRAGSILDVALGHGIEIDHACGGVAACSTCHVIVRQGHASCPAAAEAEEDMLDTAPGVTLTSRLACQAVPDGSSDVVVEIPGWNRNHAREHH